MKYIAHLHMSMDADITAGLCKSLARVLVSFQDQYLATDAGSVPLSGLLCQVWLPRILDDGSTVQLHTKGRPFFIAGSHGADFLALFRCLSCRYEFGTDGAKPRELGAPGRVFLYSKPEFSANVQQMNASDYHRQSSARLCSVQSCILFPLYNITNPGHSLGVIEIVQNNSQMDFLRITEMILKNLMRHNLTSNPIDDVILIMNQSNEFPEMQMPIRQTVTMVPPVVDASVSDFGWNDGPSTSFRNINNTSVSEKNQRRLGTRLSNSNLQNLMKKKKIKTLKRHNVAKYEEDVDLSLLDRHEDVYKNPLSIHPGMDSRWKRVQDIPSRSKVSGDSDDDCPDGAFAVKSSRSGKIKYWSKKGSSKRMSPPAGAGFGIPAGRSRASAIPSNANATPISEKVLEMPHLERLSDPRHENSVDTSKNSSEKDKTQSEDWIGMIDPAMVELMMTEDLGTDFGDIGDIPDLL